MLQWRKLVFFIFGLLALAAFLVFKHLPEGFIPEEDQGYFIIVVNGPNGSSLYRTEETVKKVVALMQKTDGVAHVISINGFNIIDTIDEPNTAALFVTLKPWSERTAANLSAQAIIKKRSNN